MTRQRADGRSATVAVNSHVQPAPEGSLLTPAEVAARLAVSRSWVYDAAKDGRIPSIRIGGAHGPLRFLAADLENWLADARAAWLPGDAPAATRPAPSHNPAGEPIRSGRAHAT